MTFVEGIPSHVLQNMASVQANINSIMANASRIGGATGSGFDNLLQSAAEDLSSGFSDDFGTSNVRYSNQAYNTVPAGTAGNLPELMNKPGNLGNLSNAETNQAVNKAYQSLLNGDTADNFSSIIGATDKNNIIEQLKVRNPDLIDKNVSLITDNQFYNAESMTPQQINEYLKKKGSPFAYQTFENGKSAGQLIYDACHLAGTMQQGPNTINPAMILAIMGAESGFGTDPTIKNKQNPFNIKLYGSFNNVTSFEDSVKIAVNTMYNWAQSRPEGSNVSLLDFSGDKYCENYSKEWKPNVEKYYAEIANSYSSAPTAKTEVSSNLVNQMLSAINQNYSGNSTNGIMAMLGNLGNQTSTQNGMMSVLKNMNIGNNNDAENGELSLISKFDVLSAISKPVGEENESNI